MARAALRHARVQQVRAGAPPVTRLALGVLHYLRPLCLPLAISHCSFLLPWALLNTIALPLTVRLVLDRTSMSKASALASGHAAVCYLLLRALSELQEPLFARPPSSLSVDPLCSEIPSKTALSDRSAETGRVTPSPTRQQTPAKEPTPLNAKEGGVQRVFVACEYGWGLIE